MWDAEEVAGIGFLHTAEAHVESFGALVSEIDPALACRHVVRVDLLERAQHAGVGDPGVREQVRSAITDLAQTPVSVTVCTCSTIGGLAEDCAAELGVPGLRVDRPMAELAVRRGSRIAVVATLQSTLAPTRTLLHEAALAAGVEIEVTDAPCLDAWDAFEAGDLATYHRHVASHLDRLDPSIDVLVLAQASMAAAAELTISDRLILSSPRLGVQRACALAQ